MTILTPAPLALDALTVVRELNHRINNDFTSAINIVSVGVMLAEDSEVKAALSKVVELLHQYAEVHRALAIPQRGALTDAAEYLRRLGVAIQAIEAGSHQYSSHPCRQTFAASRRPVLALGAGRPRAGDQFSETCVFRQPRWRDQD